MAIKKVGEVWEGRSGEGTEELTRAYVRVFRVLTTDKNDGATLVANAPGIPIAGETFADANGNVDSGARCKRVRAEQEQDDPTAWKVTCEYSSDKPEDNQRDPAKQNQDPLLRPPEIKISFTAYKRLAVGDPADGSSDILNSADDPYDPPIEIDDHRLVITYTVNTATFNLAQAVLYLDCVNSDSFLGLPPNRWKINGWSGDESFENGLVYWKQTIEIECRGTGVEEGYTFRVLDQGYQAIDPATGNKVVVKDEQGQPYSQPVLLDGSGHKLAAGGTPFYNDYDLYTAEPFSALGIESAIQDALNGH